MYLENVYTTYMGKVQKCLPIELPVFPPEAVTMTDSHELVEKHL